MTHGLDEHEASANDADHVAAHPAEESTAGLPAARPTGMDGQAVVDLDAARERRHDQPTGTTDGDKPAAGDNSADGDAVGDADEGAEGEDAPVAVPVDRPENQAPVSRLAALRDADLRPILPSWLRSAADAQATAVWAVGLAAHTLVYHLTRLPKYVARLVARSPRGLWRLVYGVVRWIFDMENEPLRQGCASRQDTEAYLKLVRERDRHVRWRGMVTAALTPFAAVTVTVAAWLAPAWALWASAGLVVAALGVVGRPADRPLLDAAVTVADRPRLTSDMVTHALSALRIPALTQALAKDPRAVRFVAPIHRDGPGFRAELDLPPGAVAADVIDERDRLAANLSRPLGCVWPEGASEIHPGRLVLWVGDRELSRAKQPEWPLAKRGTVDLFAAFPFGTDQRGRTVKLSMMFASMIIGAVPRMGKTFALRLILIAAALDPRAQLNVFDLKGMGDFAPLEPVAHRYRAGDDPEDIAYVLAAAKEVQAEITRRAKYVRGLPRHLCPESKITPELASNPRHGLFPIIFAIDETQKGFDDERYGKELAKVCEDITRRGPAAGIIPIWATQRPDARSLPTGISSNAVLRFCLKVKDQQANDMVLGTSAYKQGTRATMFSRRDLGIGILDGEETEPQITRTYFLDGPAADAVIARARQLREDAGTLSGHALGESTNAEAAVASHNLLDDIAAVCPTGGGEQGHADGKYWSATIVERLAAHRPEVYRNWTANQLAAALEAHGVDTDQIGRRVDGKTINRRGIDVHDVHEALTRRDGEGRAA